MAVKTLKDDNQGTTEVYRDGGWSPRFAAMLLVLILISEIGYLVFAYPLNAGALIGAEFHTNQVAWLQTAYALVAAVTAATIGKLADRFGKRKMILILLAMGAAGSFLAAAAPDFNVMMVGRVIQAPVLCLPFLLPSLIRDIFPTKTIPFAVSMSSGGSGLLSIGTSLAVGAVISGLGFRATFWLPGALAVALIVLLLLFVPESDVRTRSRIDWVGSALLGLGLAGVLFGVSVGASLGWTSPVTLGAIGLGVVLLALWVNQALRTEEPLVDLRELKKFPFAVTLLIAAIGFNGGSFFYVLMSMVALNKQPGWGLGLDPSQVGVLAMLFSLGQFLMALLIGRLLTRMAAPVVSALVMLTLAAAYFVSLLGLQDPTVFAIAAFLAGAGGGGSYSIVYNLVIVIVRPERQATSSGAVTVSGNVCAAVFPVAVFAVMNSMMVTGPEGVPAYSTSAMWVAMIAGAASGLIGVVFSLALHRSQKRQGSTMMAGQHS